MARSQCLHAGLILLLALPLSEAARPAEAPTQAAALQPGGAFILEHRKDNPAVATSTLMAEPAALLQARQQVSPPPVRAGDAFVQRSSLPVGPPVVDDGTLDDEWTDDDEDAHVLKVDAEQAIPKPVPDAEELDHSTGEQIKRDVEGTEPGPPTSQIPVAPALPVSDANESPRSQQEDAADADVKAGGLGGPIPSEGSAVKAQDVFVASEGSESELPDDAAPAMQVAAPAAQVLDDSHPSESPDETAAPAEIAAPAAADETAAPEAAAPEAAAPEAEEEPQGRHIAPEDVPRPEDIERRELFKATEAKSADLQTAANSIDTTINKVNVAVDKVDGAMGDYHSSINGLSVNFGDLNKMAQDMHGEVLSEFQAREKERMCAFENADRMMRGEPVQPCDGSLGLGDYHAPTSVINNDRPI